MSLKPVNVLGTNFSYDSSSKTVTIDLNDFTADGDLPTSLALESGLPSFGNDLSERNARQILLVLLLMHYHHQEDNAEENPEYPLSVTPNQPDIENRSGVLSRRNTLEVSAFESISNQTGLINPGEIQ